MGIGAVSSAEPSCSCGVRLLTTGYQLALGWAGRRRLDFRRAAVSAVLVGASRADKLAFRQPALPT
jgi:hypothetical protein